jgi:hypothetical protein
MFRSYDHLQMEIYTDEINSTDNGSVVLLEYLLSWSSMVTGVFLVTVNVVNCWRINYWCPAVVLLCG